MSSSDDSYEYEGAEFYDDDDEFDEYCYDEDLETSCIWNFGEPELADEYCNFICKLRTECWAMFESQPDCPRRDEERKCGAEHYGKCYLPIPRWRRFLCRLSIKFPLPEPDGE